eukprot:4086766-Alexandrium_andersonii.AAC.1
MSPQSSPRNGVVSRTQDPTPPDTEISSEAPPPDPDPMNRRGQEASIREGPPVGPGPWEGPRSRKK